MTYPSDEKLPTGRRLQSGFEGGDGGGGGGGG